MANAHAVPGLVSSTRADGADSRPKPEFDPCLVPRRVQEWREAAGKTALVGLSRQLHLLLRTFEPQTISVSPGPYPHNLIAQVFGRYIASKRSILVHPQRKHICMAHRDAIGMIFQVESFPWNEMHIHLRRHLMLMDVIR